MKGYGYIALNVLTVITLLLMAFYLTTNEYIQANNWQVYSKCINSVKPSVGKTLDDHVRCHNEAVSSGKKLKKALFGKD